MKFIVKALGTNNSLYPFATLSVGEIESLNHYSGNPGSAFRKKLAEDLLRILQDTTSQYLAEVHVVSPEIYTNPNGTPQNIASM